MLNIRRICKLLVLPLLLTIGLGACAQAPSAVGHQYATEDGSHWFVQATMSTGVYNSPDQTMMIAYNKCSGGKPIATVTGQSQAFSAQLVQAVLNLGPSAVAGRYYLEGDRLIADSRDCTAGANCGTSVLVQNTAGASSTAGAQAGT